MFLVNSRHPLVCAPAQKLPSERASFSRTYGGILPSSLNVVLSSALVFSTSPPVSVYGTILQWGYFQEPLSGPPNPIRENNLRDPSPPHGPGILTWFPSTTPFGLALGVGLPCSDQLSAGTLGLSATGSLTLFVATHGIILASDLSTGWLTPRLHRKLLVSNPTEVGKDTRNYVTLRSATMHYVHPQLRLMA